MEAKDILSSLKTAQSRSEETQALMVEVERALAKNYSVVVDAKAVQVGVFYDPINQALLVNGKMVPTDETAALAKYFKFLEETGLNAELPDTKDITDEKVS